MSGGGKAARSGGPFRESELLCRPIVMRPRYAAKGRRTTMDQKTLDKLQADYRAAVDAWVAAIRAEEALASVDHSVADLDKWEAAHYAEHTAHREVLFRKRLYEDGLRRELFGF
jgi:hypothetical protein